MSAMVVGLRIPCWYCPSSDLEVAVAGEWVAVDLPDGRGVEAHAVWCLACGETDEHFFAPGEFAEAQRSATYAAS